MDVLYFVLAASVAYLTLVGCFAVFHYVFYILSPDKEQVAAEPSKPATQPADGAVLYQELRQRAEAALADFSAGVATARTAWQKLADEAGELRALADKASPPPPTVPCQLTAQEIQAVIDAQAGFDLVDIVKKCIALHEDKKGGRR